VSPVRDPWDDWDEFASEHRERERTDERDDRPVVRSRLVRGTIWFALAVMPAQERWIGWDLDSPHPVVQPHPEPVTSILEVSLPSGP
jgi:hypothetical protein